MASSNISLGQLAKKLNNFANGAVPTVQKAVQDFNDHDDTGHPHAIIASIVATTPSGIVEDKPNRIWTGHMFKSGDAKVRAFGDSVAIDFGWFDYKEYIEWQETGVHPTGKEKPIEPMNALYQVAQALLDEDDVDSAITTVHNYLKDLWRKS